MAFETTIYLYELLKDENIKLNNPFNAVFIPQNPDEEINN